MRLKIFLAVLLSAVMQVSHVSAEQSVTVSPAPTPSKDPRALLDAAIPHYDFSDTSLKPWHLKAHYQLYDLKGNLTEQGTWEHWWASPKVHRSSWQRAGMVRTEWATSDGAIYRKETGGASHYFERNIEAILLFPMPSRSMIDSDRMKLDIKTLGQGPASVTCVTSILQWKVDGKLQAPSSAVPQYHCFDIATMALLETYSNSMLVQYSRIAKIQDHYLAQNVSVLIGKQTAFSVSIESIDGISASDPALNPANDAVPVLDAARHTQEPASDVTTGSLVKKSQPVYPTLAKAARDQGIVVLGAVIGTNGKIKDLEVLASPSKLLTVSAVDSVKRWEYRPYLLNGQPVEVETVVNVAYSLSY